MKKTTIGICRCLSWVTRLALLLFLLPAAVQAQFRYTTTNGTITITGYTGSGATATIPATINGLPVTAIGDLVFEYCTNLTNIIIPGTVTNIGDFVFYNCTGLTAIEVDPSNPAYSSVDGVLYDQSQTTLVQCPGGKVGSYTVPDTVTGIGYYACYNCSSLTNITMGDSVTNLGVDAFAECAGLASITMGNGVASIGDYAFDGCTSLASITIPNSVTSIGYYAFAGCTSLTNATISNSITSITGSAFENCISLTSIMMGNSVASIGDYAFENCISLTNVAIPKSVTTIGNSTFGGCTNLAAITVDPLNPAYSSLDGVLFDKHQTVLIQCPARKAGSYTVPNTVTAIVFPGFAYCASLTNVTIPNGVTSLGNVFEYCTSLVSVAIPNSVYSLGATFAGCTSLASVTISNNVNNIGNSTFADCTSLTNVTIPNSVTTIGDFAFADCTSLASVNIPGKVASIGLHSFENCASLTAITVDASNSVYGSVDGILYNRSQTTLIAYPGGRIGSCLVPNGTSLIGESAFAYCTNMTSVTLPNSVTTIAYGAFEYCTGLTNIIMGTNVTSIGSYAFAYCTSLASVTIPNSMTYIPDRAFLDCTSLATVTIPTSVAGLYPGAFLNCTGLKGIYFRGNAPGIISSDVFGGDTNTIVYHVPGKSGWSSTFGGRPTALWLPQLQIRDRSFGVQTNQFGFNINWASGQVVVVETCTDLSYPLWSPLQTITLSADSTWFSDPHSTHYPGLFYRVHSP